MKIALSPDSRNVPRNPKGIAEFGSNTHYAVHRERIYTKGED
jgi:hypothetical protein